MLEHKSVLIVEDEMLIALNVEQVARDLGAAATRIVRAEGALSLARTCSVVPDICVVDFRSANGRKKSIAQALFSARTKVILMTTDSHSDDDDLYRVADAVVRKPFGDEELFAAFQYALTGADRTRAWAINP